MSKTKTGKRLYEFYRKETGDFFVLFRKIQHHPSQGDIHRMRVLIKKMRTFGEMMDRLIPGGKSGRYGIDIFKKYFHSLGKVREIQVNRNLVKNLNCPDEKISGYLSYLSVKKKKRGKNLRKTGRRFDCSWLRDLEKKLAKDSAAGKFEGAEKKIPVMISRKISSVKRILKEGTGERNLHLARMAVRKLETMVCLAEETAMYIDKNGLRSILNGMLKELGAWHDRQVLASSLRKFIESGKAGSESGKKYFSGLIRKLRKEVPSVSFTQMGQGTINKE